MPSPKLVLGHARRLAQQRREAERKRDKESDSDSDSEEWKVRQDGLCASCG